MSELRRRARILLPPLIAAAAAGSRAAEGSSERPDVGLLRERLEHILASGYQLSEPPQAHLHAIIARAMRALRELLGGLSEAGPLSDLPPWAGPVLTGVLVVLLALMVAHIAASLRGLLGGAASRRHDPEREPERREPDSVLREAEAAFARGEHDAALRLLYRAVLLRLDRLGLLRHDPARTNWENLHALRAPGTDVRDAMVQLTAEMDGCIYGGRLATRESWERARGWTEILWRAEGRL